MVFGSSKKGCFSGITTYTGSNFCRLSHIMRFAGSKNCRFSGIGVNAGSKILV